MSFRIHRDRHGQVRFEGLLDQEALEALRLLAQKPLRVILAKGTALEPDLIPALKALPVELLAESAYLARWLEVPGTHS